MRMISAFICGAMEFRQSLTTSYEYPYSVAYDRGRELAHIVTFRRFDDN